MRGKPRRTRRTVGAFLVHQHLPAIQASAPAGGPLPTATAFLPPSGHPPFAGLKRHENNVAASAVTRRPGRTVACLSLSLAGWERVAAAGGRVRVVPYFRTRLLSPREDSPHPTLSHKGRGSETAAPVRHSSRPKNTVARNFRPCRIWTTQSPGGTGSAARHRGPQETEHV